MAHQWVENFSRAYAQSAALEDIAQRLDDELGSDHTMDRALIVNLICTVVELRERVAELERKGTPDGQ